MDTYTHQINFPSYFDKAENRWDLSAVVRIDMRKYAGGDVGCEESDTTSNIYPIFTDDLTADRVIDPTTGYWENFPFQPQQQSLASSHQYHHHPPVLGVDEMGLLVVNLQHKQHSEEQKQFPQITEAEEEAPRSRKHTTNKKDSGPQRVSCRKESSPTNHHDDANSCLRIIRVPAEQLQCADKWAWRKYGEKPIKGSPHHRSYYKCSNGCMARKRVERCPTDPETFVITYFGGHSHRSPVHRNALSGKIRKASSALHSTSYALSGKIRKAPSALHSPNTPLAVDASTDE